MPAQAASRGQRELETSFKTLRYEEDDGVAVVTLDRPEVHNAFNQEMQEELRQLWRDLRGHDPVRAIILTGAGDKAFCSGIDRDESIEQGYLEDVHADRAQAPAPHRASWPRPSSTTIRGAASTRNRTTCGSRWWPR